MASRGRSAKAKGSAFERKIAGVLGGRRAPLSGAVGGGDVWGGELSDHFTLELKKRAKLPVLITAALKQASQDAGYGTVLKPAVICEEDHGQPIICFWLEDFLSVFRGLQELPERSNLRNAIRKAKAELDFIEQTIRGR